MLLLSPICLIRSFMRAWPSPAILCGVAATSSLAASNKAGVISFTFLSVDCADSTTAHKSSNPFLWSRGTTGLGKSSRSCCSIREAFASRAASSGRLVLGLLAEALTDLGFAAWRGGDAGAALIAGIDALPNRAPMFFFSSFFVRFFFSWSCAQSTFPAIFPWFQDHVILDHGGVEHTKEAWRRPRCLRDGLREGRPPRRQTPGAPGLEREVHWPGGGPTSARCAAPAAPEAPWLPSPLQKSLQGPWESILGRARPTASGGCCSR